MASPYLPRERGHLEVRPRKDHRGVDLISDALPLGQLSYGGPGAMLRVSGHDNSSLP